PNGTAATYQNCYDLSWGRHKARTYPVTGNHDYDSSATAAGYFGYFGTAAGDPTKGYYSYDLGAWHIVVLNGNSSFVATAAGSPQTPAGAADPLNGIREIIVGTGGEGLDSPNTLIIPNSEARISGVYGVLKLTLYDGSYAWQFVPVAGQTATDSGSASCH